MQRADFAYLFAGLDKNGYDKSKCEDVFDLYIKCKKREVSLKADQRSLDSGMMLEMATLPQRYLHNTCHMLICTKMPCRLKPDWKDVRRRQLEDNSGAH